MKAKINKTNGNKLIKNLFASLFNKGIINIDGINGMIFVRLKPRSLDIKYTEISNAKSIKNVCNVSVHIIVLIPPRKV